MRVSTLRRITALAIAASAVAAPTAGAACATSTPFKTWGDANPYALVLNGNLEAGTMSPWTATGAVAVVAQNEPWKISGAGTRALSIGSGATATGTVACTGIVTPIVRFFVRNTGSSSATLTTTLLTRNANGGAGAVVLGSLKAGTAWAVSPAYSYIAPTGVQVTGVRLTSSTGGAFVVDDVYIDPYRRV